jgi:hypothetical protein
MAKKRAAKGNPSQEQPLDATEGKEAEAPKKKRPRGTGSPTFMNKSEIANELSVTTEAIDKWIAAGTFPPPHSRPGKHTSLWLRSHYQHFVKHREWPRAAYPSIFKS